MTTALYRAYCRVKDGLPDSFEWQKFQEHFKHWDIIDLLDSSGDCCGCVMQKGSEVHIVYWQDPKFSIIKHLRLTLEKVIRNYGQAVTCVEIGNDKSMVFCKRLGFVPVEIRDGITWMVCHKHTYQRDKK